MFPCRQRLRYRRTLLALGALALAGAAAAQPSLAQGNARAPFARSSAQSPQELQQPPTPSTTKLALRNAVGEDAPHAVPPADKGLVGEPSTQQAWFERAAELRSAGKWEEQASALERGVAFGGDVLERRSELVRVLLDHRQLQRAALHVDAGLKALSGDTALLSTWVGYLEELNRTDDALAVWRRANAADPKR